MIEQTLVLVKPDGVKRGLIGEVIRRFEKRGLKIVGMKMLEVDPDFSKKHYAAHVDIHNKPGYDPCELFMGWPPLSVSRNHSKIQGSHGRIDKPVAWTSTCDFADEPSTLMELASETQNWLEQKND